MHTADTSAGLEPLNDAANLANASMDSGTCNTCSQNFSDNLAIEAQTWPRCTIPFSFANSLTGSNLILCPYEAIREIGYKLHGAWHQVHQIFDGRWTVLWAGLCLFRKTIVTLFFGCV